jgi:NAD(P)-dependent dehydrogenase (short-subunit alcohol dehydrogenase family)
VGLFDGKVALVTGAGRGIGRAEAMVLAAEGARVVVNDLGGSVTGEGHDGGPAQRVVDEIVDGGGTAVANADDCSTWTGAEAMVRQALDAFGALDVLVCNAGIVRDRMSFNMTEDEFDAVVRVHLKGHVAPIRFAAAHWRSLAKASGAPVEAAIVTTTSEAGLYGNVGQVNYVAAKAGIAAMTVSLARELEPVGVRVNSISPVAATRILRTAGTSDEIAADPRFAPENAAAGAVWLASPLAEGINGQVLKIRGGIAQIVDGWRPRTQLDGPDLWTVEALADGRGRLFAGRDPGVPPFRATEQVPPPA